MQTWVFDGKGGLRNGWWVLLFLALMAAALLAFWTFAAFLHEHGLRLGDGAPALLFLLSLGATGICARLRGEPLASVGFRMGRRWAAEFGWGALLGAAVMLVAGALVRASGSIAWELDPGRSLGALASGLVGFAFVALWEENLFRGFLFQRLVDGLGVRPAQLLGALLFALAHWGNPGMGGATKLWATLNLVLAALFLGLAYLRTRSLALPVGIHLGWNWTQGNLLGFGVSGTSGQPGWIRPVFRGGPEWVSGGAFGLEASLLGTAAVLAGLLLLWRWPSGAPSTGPDDRCRHPG